MRNFQNFHEFTSSGVEGHQGLVFLPSASGMAKVTVIFNLYDYGQKLTDFVKF
jgi:hypothetical protein